MYWLNPVHNTGHSPAVLTTYFTIQLNNHCFINILNFYASLLQTTGFNSATTFMLAAIAKNYSGYKFSIILVATAKI